MVLWLSLRDRRLDGFKFIRQEAIESFVVDFACREKHLIVEVDGGQHAENPEDLERDRRLSEAGYRVLRFWNNDVLKNKFGVLETILSALNE
jgi:very-short-patch-repair endonuclease